MQNHSKPPLAGWAGKLIWLTLGLAGLSLAAYLSLRSSPALSTIPWLPGRIAHWADAHPRFDNFPAYGLIGLPFFFLVSQWRSALVLGAGLILFVVLVETAQLGLAHRHCDPWDILWGGLGIIAGGLLAITGRLGWASWWRRRLVLAGTK